MSYKCMMCQQPISKNEDEWGMEISLTKWMHYKCIEHLWDVYSSMRKPQQATRVRCTKDGEFPLKGDEVIFQAEGRKSYIGYFTIQDNENVFIANDGYAYWTANENIYWQLYEDLKTQYDMQKSGETKP